MPESDRLCPMEPIRRLLLSSSLVKAAEGEKIRWDPMQSLPEDEGG